jgi:type IVB pilus formation R64 PilN family outer membrane protein
MLAACHSPTYNQTVGNVADVKLKLADAWAKSDDDATIEPALVVKKGLYVDRKPINLERQPYWLQNHIVIAGDQLPFSYYTRVIAAGANTHVLTKYQVGLDQSAKVSLSYSGTIKGAMDLIASKTGYVYSIRGDRVYWQAFVTRTYDIAFLPGDTDYLMGQKSGGGGANTSQQSSQAQVANYTTSDSSNDEYSNLTAKLSVWSDLNNTIKTLLSSEGSVTVSQATSTITVRDRPSNVDLISQFVYNLNHKMSKQVLVKIQVIEVNLENDYQMGINWQLIINAFHNSPFVINGNYGTPVSITPFVPQGANNTMGGVITNPPPILGTNYAQSPTSGVPNYTILLNALNQQGKASIVSEPRVVCLNNQVSVVRIVDNVGYVASIQNTTLGSNSSGNSSNNGNTVTSQVTPGALITGLTLYILPKIMNHDVYMQVNADLSSNNGFGSFGGIQLPNITEKHFNQRGVIQSGSTLILAGFRQMSNNARANQFVQWQALGGKGSQQLNKETVILITPLILSENVAMNGSG